MLSTFSGKGEKKSQNGGEEKIWMPVTRLQIGIFSPKLMICNVFSGTNYGLAAH